MFRPIARRMMPFVAIGTFFAIATVLLLADRSTSIVFDIHTVVVNLGQSIEQTLNINVVDRGDFPGTFDQIGHALLWGTGTFLVGFSLRRVIPVPITAIFMMGASLAFEVAQPILSTTRAFESADAVGNIVGVVGATIVLVTGLALADLRTRTQTIRSEY